MKYYTIQNNGLLIADNEQALTRFYGNVSELPEDYEVGKYIVKDGELVLNPNGEEEISKKEKERIAMLKMTPLDFLKALQSIGISYQQIKALCDANDQVDMELRFCNHVYRGNLLLDQLAAQFGVTSAQLDTLFETYGN